MTDERDEWEADVQYQDDSTDLLRSFVVAGDELPDVAPPPIEAIIERDTEPSKSLTGEQTQIYTACGESRSVAELSAMASLPLGATRVIVAQLMSANVLRAHETMTSELANDIRFMRRLRDLVLDS